MYDRWVNVGSDIVARDAGILLRLQYVFGRKLPRLVDPAPDRGLRYSKSIRHCGLRHIGFANLQKRFVSGRYWGRHTLTYNDVYTLINGKVA